jgi:hypothetical protein
MRPELLGLKRMVPPVAGTPLTETTPVTVASFKDVSVRGLPSPQPCMTKTVKIAIARKRVVEGRNRGMGELQYDSQPR